MLKRIVLQTIRKIISLKFSPSNFLNQDFTPKTSKFRFYRNSLTKDQKSADNSPVFAVNSSSKEKCVSSKNIGGFSKFLLAQNKISKPKTESFQGILFIKF